MTAPEPEVWFAVVRHFDRASHGVTTSPTAVFRFEQLACDFIDAEPCRALDSIQTCRITIEVAPGEEKP